MFEGFTEPKSNFSKLPHQFIEILPRIETKGEMAVILYILRHTWGFQDSHKKITLDEFENGRKRADGTRMDGGTGLSRPTILDGLARAEEHGFINVECDGSDKARVKKVYSLRMEGSRNLTPDVKKLDTGGKDSLHRTEKETLERNSRKKTNDAISPHKANFSMLARVCKIDLDTITPKLRGKLNLTECVLREKKGTTSDDIKQFGLWWYKHWWQGEDGQPPRPMQVREEWGRFEDWRKGHKNEGVMQV